MAPSRIIVAVIAGIMVAGAVAGFAVTWRSPVAAVEPPAPNSFDPILVRRGRALAATGNCADCHTLRGGKDFAGGFPVSTPFGTIYSSNITPDPQTGIGRWPESAFRRAMRSGVDRDGRHLYPTFPYDHFINVTDEDDRALYAWLMTRQPVDAPARRNELPFPYNQRFLIAGWKLLFLHRGEWQPDPARSAEYNRGGYLVEGLAHCGACHTPRNALGAERKNAQFSGGESDNWAAYAINARSPSPVPWDAEALFGYLRQGWHPDHGVARGPMAQVVANLSSIPESDVRAIAVYMADKFGAPTPERKRRAGEVLARPGSPDQNPAGAAIYTAACAGCHDAGRPPPYGGINLRLSTGISNPDPRNVINTILSGLRPVEGERSPIMPGFAASMDDAQIAALLNYLRARYSDQPAWTGLEKIIADARRGQTVFLNTSAEPYNAPIDPAQRDRP
ncbi:MAG TPA: cytochrome c [Bradyrhizobium sp.]|nr:cytochrome c [Bradyrhizobium sp.]